MSRNNLGLKVTYSKLPPNYCYYAGGEKKNVKRESEIKK